MNGFVYDVSLSKQAAQETTVFKLTFRNIAMQQTVAFQLSREMYALCRKLTITHHRSAPTTPEVSSIQVS
jgi:purine-nucleoside phosphorylase